MTVVVLGGCGFLGRHVMAQLAASGHDAITRSRRDGCDLTQLESVTAALRQARPEVVINCAAHVGSVQYAVAHAAEMIHDNVQMIVNLYRAVLTACPRARVVNPLSNCSYPGAAALQREADWQAGPVHDSVLAYGMPRRLLDAVARCYAAQYQIRTVSFLMANAYGPGDGTDPDRVHALDGLIIRLIQAQRAEARQFEIWGSGQPIREWVYIEDAARFAVHLATTEAPPPSPINLAQRAGYSIAQIAAMVAQHLQYDVPFVFNTRYPDGAPAKILEDTQFRQQFPRFRFTPLARGLEHTVAYYRQALAVPAAAAVS